MADVNLGRVQGLTTSITLNGETKTQVDGDINIGNLIVPDDTNPYVQKNTIGDLSDLETFQKTNIVAAINELNDLIISGPLPTPGPVTDVKTIAYDKTVTLQWDDPENTEGGTDPWSGTVVVYKTNGFPESMNDGFVVTTSIIRNQYSETTGNDPLLISGLVNNVEIFISIFTFNSKGETNLQYAYKVSAMPYTPRDMIAILDLSNPDPTTAVTYSGDATSMIPGSDAWDVFFGYKPCIISSSTGERLGYLMEDDFTKYDHGGDAPVDTNFVMIEFPRRGVTITKIDTKLHIRITDDLSLSDVRYLAHTNNNNVVENMYIATYPIIDKYSTGLYGPGLVTGTDGLQQAISYCDSIALDGLIPMHWYQYNYIQAMAIMKYRTTDIKAAFGSGLATPSTFTCGIFDTLGMNATQTGHLKMFGLEEIYGTGWSQQIDGLRTDIDKKVYAKGINTDTYVDTGLVYFDEAPGSGEIYRYISNLAGIPEAPFLGVPEYNASATTYMKALKFISPGTSEYRYIGTGGSSAVSTLFTIGEHLLSVPGVYSKKGYCRLAYMPMA